MQYFIACRSWILFNGSNCFLSPPIELAPPFMLLLWTDDVVNIVGVMSLVPFWGKKPGGAVLFPLTRIGLLFPFSWLTSFFRATFRNWAKGEFARSSVALLLGVWVSSEIKIYYSNCWLAIKLMTYGSVASS